MALAAAPCSQVGGAPLKTEHLFGFPFPDRRVPAPRVSIPRRTLRRGVKLCVSGGLSPALRSCRARPSRCRVRLPWAYESPRASCVCLAALWLPRTSPRWALRRSPAWRCRQLGFERQKPGSRTPVQCLRHTSTRTRSKHAAHTRSAIVVPVALKYGSRQRGKVRAKHSRDVLAKTRCEVECGYNTWTARTTVCGRAISGRASGCP